MLKSIIATLNNIEVRGKENLDRLLGCIQALEELEKAISSKEESSDG